MTARTHNHSTFVSPRHTPSISALSTAANPSSPAPSLTGLGGPATAVNVEKHNGLPISRIVLTFASILIYSSCSVSMILLNKVVTAIYKLEGYAVQMVLIQCLAGAVLAWMLKKLHLVDFPPIDTSLLRQWLPVTVLFISMLLSSLLALHTMSLAMYTLLKNGALFLTAMGDVYFFRRELLADQYLGFFFMLIGSILSGGDDRWLTAHGVFWTVLNIVLTAAYNLRLKKVLADHKEWGGHWAPMFYNNAFAVCILFPVVMWGPPGGFAGFAESLQELPAMGVASVCMFVAAGAVLSGASLWCLRLTTPTTYCVVGATCKIPNILLGAIIFEQYPTNRGVLGIIVAFAGIYLYTWASLQGEKAACPTSPSPASQPAENRTRRRSQFNNSNSAEAETEGDSTVTKA